MKRLRVLHLPVEGPPEVLDIEHTTEALQELVGGSFFDIVACGPRHDLFVNDEGLLLELPLNASATVLAGQPLVGPAFLARHDGEGETVSIEDADLEAFPAGRAMLVQNQADGRTRVARIVAPIVKRCGCCERTYTLEAWRALPGCGAVDSEDETGRYSCELRNCPCGSTIGIERRLP